MRFLIGLLVGALIGGVLTILATGNAGRALQAQMRERAQPADQPAPSRDN